ncbi:MAG: glycogen/starch synthase, partial [Ktedonobacterales bacterium]
MSHLIPSGQRNTALNRIPTASDLPLSGPPPRPPSDPEPLTSPPLDVESAQGGARLRILILAAECAPYVKSGGVADVIGSLARALRRMGHDVRVFLPRYGMIDPERWDLRRVVEAMPVPVGDGETRVDALEAVADGGGRVYFIDAPAAFDREHGTIGYPDDGERFILFNRAARELTRALDWAPDVIHCHDWYASITPNWLKTTYRDTPQLKAAASVLTIHNLQYHGIFGYRILEVAGIEQPPFFQAEESQRDAVDLLGR